MVSQTSIAICALCKNPLESRADLQISPKRLCGKCCSLIETIFPQAASRSVHAIHSVPLAGSALDSLGVQTLAEPQGAILPVENFVDPTEPQAFTGNAFNEIAGNNGSHKARFVQAERDFAPIYQAEDSGLYFQEPPDPLPSTNGVDAPLQLSNPDQPQAPEFAQQPAANAESFQGNENSLPAAQPEHFNHQENQWSENGWDTAQPLNQATNLVSENPTSDFPYLVPDKSRTNAKVLGGVVALAVLAGLVAAYVFIYKPFFGGGDHSDSSKIGVNNVDDKAAAKPPVSNPEGGAQTASAKSPASKSEPAEAKKIEETKTVETPSGVDATAGEAAKFALQAGVFSTQENAGKLAEQLKRAGIPAYIAPSKANKFRVLVGKFVSNGEAQKFIPQAQARANTAGIRLELFACEINP